MNTVGIEGSKINNINEVANYSCLVRQVAEMSEDLKCASKELLDVKDKMKSKSLLSCLNCISKGQRKT